MVNMDVEKYVKIMEKKTTHEPPAKPKINK